MTVNVRYFALLGEEAGASSEVVETSARTLRGLWEELERRHRFSLGSELVLPALDDEFCGWETDLVPGREVAFMPPVSGG